MTDIKHRLIDAADQPDWRKIFTAAHDHIAAQEKQIVELRSDVARLDAARHRANCDVQLTPMREQNARFAIDGAIAFGMQGTNRPPESDHWLMEYWEIGRQLAAPADAIDAERYRFLRKLENDKNPQQYDAVVDSAMKAAK